MMKKAFFLPLFLTTTLPGALVRIDISEQSTVLDGKSFGSVGPYDRLVGKAYFAVDPKLPANRIICDIDKAPRNEKGLVEFSSDLYILKPRDSKNGNGAVLFEASNRGGKLLLDMFDRATASSDPREPGHFGDNFLLEKGYTLVWLGWQLDVPHTKGRLRLDAPIATNGGRPITGPVRSEIIVDKREFSHSIGDRNHIPYPFADPQDSTLVLTVRDRNDGPRRAMPRNAWKIVEGTHIAVDAGFEPGKIYEIVYTAKDPGLAGLGPAAIRDLISFLKHGGGSRDTPLADQHNFINRSYAYGISQTGRFLRTFLYDGFNADESGKKVLDGVLAHIAGAGRGNFNIRFGQPSRDAHPFLNLFYSVDIFPFTDGEQTDPETGVTDGLLTRTEKAGVMPKIFYTNTAYEYWGRAGALIHTSVDGKKDAPIPLDTRIYFFAGGQHSRFRFPGLTRFLQNTNPFTWCMRALLVDMDDWVAKGIAPPPSQYPKIAYHNLVPLNELKFPKIPGAIVPARPQRAFRVDYGPKFRTLGIISFEPPKIGKPFPTLLPQVDVDGNETSGIRMPSIQVPLGTYTGWNLRSIDIGAPDEMFSMVGSYFPFPRNKSEREQSHDPRLSVEERYKSRQDYLNRVENQARDLVFGRYLLAQDVPDLVKYGAAEWDEMNR